MALAALPLMLHAQETTLPVVVITGSPMAEPLTVITDPRAPRQPVPAHDGADYLKTIPGFSVIRKGGTDGDPVFRGMAGSRLNILLDGEQILGGCGNRMDPPTAYVFPEAYDRITVLKGPQTVRFGPGNSAGTVLFERDGKRLAAPGWKFDGSLTVGSFGRNDQVADIRAGTPDFYVRGIATRTDADDYEDGDGRKVHSAYTRWSTGAAVGWTPDDNTRLELSALKSDGEAAYGDRAMDGVKFDRENIGLRFEKRRIAPWLDKIEAQVYYNYVDHVMDNYSLRSKPAAAMYMVSNPDRETTGGRFAATLRPSGNTVLIAGADYQRNIHSLRSGSGMTPPAYATAARKEDANFDNWGVFGELTRTLGEQQRVVAGLRADRWHGEDKRAMVSGTGYSFANPTAGQSRDKTLSSGFARYEADGVAAGTLYAGIGHAQRFPDYWELISAGKESPGSGSAFASTRPEKTSQLDIGWLRTAGAMTVSLSGFYNRIDDYILIQSGVVKTGPNRTVTVVRNVDATTWGGEASVGYRFARAWRFDGSLAYVRGDNDSDGTPLAQLPPLDTRFGLTYEGQGWSLGGLLRLVAEQNRYDPNKGNIVGQDLGRTPGFGVFSINGGWRPKKGVLLSAGIDNLFNKNYAEHISRSGATMISGFEQTARVNEPGRNFWLRAQIALD